MSIYDNPSGHHPPPPAEPRTPREPLATSTRKILAVAIGGIVAGLAGMITLRIGQARTAHESGVAFFSRALEADRIGVLIDNTAPVDVARSGLEIAGFVALGLAAVLLLIALIGWMVRD
jgi:hypothetical protein